MRYFVTRTTTAGAQVDIQGPPGRAGVADADGKLVASHVAVGPDGETYLVCLWDSSWRASPVWKVLVTLATGALLVALKMLTK